ncbi:autotransporter assembly complex protein TamA [Marinospirillum alkaliphilum]|nr:autotransporter assembly complex family protein [Marinospirillum alkaliphilum]
MLLSCLLIQPVQASVRLMLEPELPEVRANIEAYLGEQEPRTTREMRRYARHARNQVSQALQALGYYQYQIRIDIEEGEPARLHLNVTPGEPVRLRHVLVELSGEAQYQRDFTLPGQTDLKPGQPLNHAAYEAAKRHFRNQGLRYGYFSARYQVQQLDINPQQGWADIHLHFDSGPRYRLGAVTFDHEGVLDEAFLQRFVTFASGTPYSTDLITDLSRDLRGSGYFHEVLVDARHEFAEDLQVPVDVLLRMRPPRTLSVGVGFSTDIGPRVTTAWTQHWLNDQGHSRGVDAEVSQPRQSVGGWYQLPLTPPMTDYLRLTSAVRKERYDEQESQRFSAGIQWHHRLDNGWDRVLSLRGEYEEFRVGADEDATWLTLPGIGLGRLRSNHRVDPSRGYRVQVDLTGSRRDLLADVDILQLTFFSRGLMTLKDHHRFLARVQGGAMATDAFEQVPASLRFFAGGDQSVRGYGYQELAPRDESGQLLGGRYLLAVGLEYQYALTDRWRLATFVDAGDAVLEPKDLKQPLLGVGVGIRWVSPVGPLRLDVARGLDEQLGGWRLHFSMGPEL